MQAKSPTPPSQSTRLTLLTLVFVALHVGALVAYRWPHVPALPFIAASWAWILGGVALLRPGQR